jgi:hypothetical protein
MSADSADTVVDSPGSRGPSPAIAGRASIAAIAAGSAGSLAGRLPEDIRAAGATITTGAPIASAPAVTAVTTVGAAHRSDSSVVTGAAGPARAAGSTRPTDTTGAWQ